MAKFGSFPKFTKIISLFRNHYQKCSLLIFILHKSSKKLSNSASFPWNKSLNIFQLNTFLNSLFGQIKLLVIWLYDLQVGCSVGWFFGLLVTWLVKQLVCCLVVCLSITLVFWLVVVHLVFWLVGWLNSWFGWLFGWALHWFFGWLLNIWFFSCMVGWTVGLSGCLVEHYTGCTDCPVTLGPAHPPPPLIPPSCSLHPQPTYNATLL